MELEEHLHMRLLIIFVHFNLQFHFFVESTYCISNILPQ